MKSIHKLLCQAEFIANFRYSNFVEQKKVQDSKRTGIILSPVILL